MKNIPFKEIISATLFFILILTYLNLPYKALDLIDIKIEKLDKTITEISLYQSKDIDYISGFKKSLKAILPFSQIIEYKKERTIYNLALFYANGNEIPKDIKEILSTINEYNSLKKYIGNDNNNSKYFFFQFLGIISVLLIIAIIYVILKKKKPYLINYYIFLLVLFYVTNLVFLGLKSDKEMLIEKTLELSYNSYR